MASALISLSSSLVSVTMGGLGAGVGGIDLRPWCRLQSFWDLVPNKQFPFQAAGWLGGVGCLDMSINEGWGKVKDGGEQTS